MKRPARKDAATAEPGMGEPLRECVRKAMDKYFARPVLQLIVNQPFGVANVDGQFDVYATVAGGGLSGQAGAIRHGITRALIQMNPEYRKVLKKAGFVTRDARVVERKKYGLRKARRAPQFTKR